MVKGGISIDIKGLVGASNYLKGKKVGVGQKVKKGLLKSAIFLQGEVKLSIAGKKAEYQSVDTGRFLNSVDFKSSNDKASVFSGLPYAQKLEYGTNFKNSPRKHFRNSADRSKPRIKAILQKEINSI